MTVLRFAPAVLWIIILTYILVRHVRVYRLYDRQMKLVQIEERDGRAEPGSTIVAVNQRVRYVVRIAQASVGILAGVAGVIATARLAFGQSLIFTAFIIGYFYLSEIATGYLTIRDENVITRIMRIDHVNEAVQNAHQRETTTDQAT